VLFCRIPARRRAALPRSPRTPTALCARPTIPAGRLEPRMGQPCASGPTVHVAVCHFRSTRGVERRCPTSSACRTCSMPRPSPCRGWPSGRPSQAPGPPSCPSSRASCSTCTSHTHTTHATAMRGGILQNFGTVLGHQREHERPRRFTGSTTDQERVAVRHLQVCTPTPRTVHATLRYSALFCAKILEERRALWIDARAAQAEIWKAYRRIHVGVSTADSAATRARARRRGQEHT
jgi:hypothetical protein